jgi:tetratricopeptide (TPR) repeat protein
MTSVSNLSVRASIILLTAVPSLSQTAQHPTYGHDIAPILYRECASCHHAGGPAPFSLLSYKEAKSHAAAIAAVTSERSMPPWLPEPGYGDFVGELGVSDAQIRLISDWAKDGAPEGPVAQVPRAPHFTEGWQLGLPDMILKAAQPFTVPASGPDVFWNFIFSPSITSTRYVRALEIRTGTTGKVHHANVFIDRLRSARRLEASPGAGFPGMEMSIAHSPFDFPGNFLFWKPGSTPWVEPPGFAWRLDPGNDLVLNAHLMTMGMPMKVQPSIGLYFTKRPPQYLPMLIQLENDGALDIPAGDRDFVIADDLRLPVDVDVLAIYPHAHYLGHVLEAYATLPNGERRWLLRIPHWDPNWQAVYHYRHPVFLPAGSVISMKYHYDNSAANPRNPNHPPKRVRSGNQSTDEMGHLWLQVLPRGPGDQRPELAEAMVRHRLERYPNDASAHVLLGALLLARLDPPDAVAQLEEAVSLAPKEADAHNGLGVAYAAVGRVREAITEFNIALTLQPNYRDAHYNLAKALVKAHQFEQAAQNFSLAAGEYPPSAQLHNDYGELLLRMGKPEAALAQFKQSLALDPSQQAAQKNVALAQQQLTAR